MNDPTTPFARHLASWYRLTPEEVTPTETPGYWEEKSPCSGRAGGCRQELHAFIGNEGPMRHTVAYRDARRDLLTGRFLSPYRTWRAARDAQAEGSEG